MLPVAHHVGESLGSPIGEQTVNARSLDAVVVNCENERHLGVTNPDLRSAGSHKRSADVLEKSTSRNGGSWSEGDDLPGVSAIATVKKALETVRVVSVHPRIGEHQNPWLLILLFPQRRHFESRFRSTPGQ